MPFRGEAVLGAAARGCLCRRLCRGRLRCAVIDFDPNAFVRWLTLRFRCVYIVEGWLQVSRGPPPCAGPACLLPLQ